MSANAYKDFIKPFTGEGDVVSLSRISGWIEKKLKMKQNFCHFIWKAMRWPSTLRWVKLTEKIGQKLRTG